MDRSWEYHAKWNKPSQELYGFTHMLDIKLNVTNGQRNKSSLTQTTVW